MATFIPTAGPPRKVEPKNGKAFTLAEMQGFVGGYIEMVDLGEHTISHVRSSRNPDLVFEVPEHAIIWLNEDGKGNGLPLNHLATLIFLECFPSLRGSDVIVGDVLLATPGESGDDDEEETDDEDDDGDDEDDEDEGSDADEHAVSEDDDGTT